MSKSRRENLKKIFAIVWLFVIVTGSWSPAFVYAQETTGPQATEEQTASAESTETPAAENADNSQDQNVNENETAESTPAVIESSEQPVDNQEQEQSQETATSSDESTSTSTATSTDGDQIVGEQAEPVPQIADKTWEMGVTGPIGGTLVRGNQTAITWQADSRINFVDITLYPEVAPYPHFIVAKHVANTGSYGWTVGEILNETWGGGTNDGHLPAGNYYIRICISGDGEHCIYSNSQFEVTENPNVPAPGPSTISGVYPDGGEFFRIGDTVKVKWQDASTTADKWWIHLRWVDQNGVGQQRFLGQADGAKEFNWTIPARIEATAWGEPAVDLPLGKRYGVAVCPYNALPCSQSPEFFSILSKGDVNPGTGWFGFYYDYESTDPGMNLELTGDNQDLIPFGPLDSEWESYRYNFWYDNDRLVRTDFVQELNYNSREYFPLDFLGADDPNEGTDHNFHFGANFVGAATVQTEGDYNFYLVSDDDFFLYVDGQLKVNRSGLAPDAGWDRSGTIHMVPGHSYRLDIFFAERHTGGSTLVFNFTTPGVTIVPCTNGVCPIEPIQPFLTVISPNGGEQWPLGSTKPITWTATSAISQVGIDLLIYNGCSNAAACDSITPAVYNLATSTANDSSFDWAIGTNFSTTSYYKVKITGVGTTTNDLSDSYFRLIDEVTGPRIIPDTLPDGTKGQSYTEDLEAVDFENPSCVAWAVSSGNLPPGLSLNASTTASTTATVGGIPTQTGSYTFTVVASSTCSMERVYKSYTISIGQNSDDDNDPAINPETLPNGTKGQSYSQQVTAIDFANTQCINWAVTSGNVPPGLSLNPSSNASTTAAVSGTPTETGTYTFTVTASSTCNNDIASRTYTITIGDGDSDDGDNGGGGGGGGSSGSRRHSSKTLPASCEPYLKKFIKFGANNDPVEVRKLQTFLRDFQDYNEVKVTGFYDKVTYDAVKRFQSNKDDILDVWGLRVDEPTGYVYISTTMKINFLYCKNYDRLTINLRGFGANLAGEPDEYEIARQMAAGGVVAGAATELNEYQIAAAQNAETEFATTSTSTEEEATSTKNFFQLAAAGFFGFIKASWWIIIIVVLLAFLAWTLLREDKDNNNPQGALPLGPASKKEDERK